MESSLGGTKGESRHLPTRDETRRVYICKLFVSFGFLSYGKRELYVNVRGYERTREEQMRFQRGYITWRSCMRR